MTRLLVVAAAAVLAVAAGVALAPSFGSRASGPVLAAGPGTAALAGSPLLNAPAVTCPSAPPRPAGPFGAEPDSSARAQAVLQNLTVGSCPFGMDATPDGSRIYVPNELSNSVSVIDAVHNTVSATITGTQFDTPLFALARPDANLVYVGSRNNSTVIVINTSTNAVAGSITLPGGTLPHGLAYNPTTHKLYVAGYGNNTIVVVDVSTTPGGVTATITGTSSNLDGPYGIALNPATGLLYAANSYDSSLGVVDINHNTVLAPVPVGQTPHGVGVSLALNRIFVCDRDDSTVYAFDGSSTPPRLLKTFALAASSAPKYLWVDQTTNRVYVSDYGTDNVTVIDAATLSIVNNIPLPTGSGARGLLVDHLNGFLYVSDNLLGKVSVILISPRHVFLPVIPQLVKQ